MSFKTWFNKNLKDSARDIAAHGADAGYSGIIYYDETTRLYNRFKGDIWEMLKECADSCGYSNTMELIASFNRKDMVEDYLSTGKLDDSAKQLLVWFACEELSHQYED